MKLSRNNTNITYQLTEFIKNAKWDSTYDFLKYYQNIVRLFMTNIDLGTRGLLIKHVMGAGKSITAVAVCVEMMRDMQPIIVASKSLHGNMIGAIKKYVELRKKHDPEWPIGLLDDAELDKWIEKNFSFVSMNASNMMAQVDRATGNNIANDFDNATKLFEDKLGEVLKLNSLDGKFIVVDEAQNLFRAIVNGSKNAIAFYNAVMKAKNLKLLFLTGTVIPNDPYESAVCFNMLAGSPILPETYREFTRLYTGENGTIKNKGKYQNRIMGLVSSIDIDVRPGSGITADGQPISTASMGEFPTQNPLQVRYVNMDREQYILYMLARDREKEESKRGHSPNEGAMLVKPKGKSSSTYRVRSRQFSNFAIKFVEKKRFASKSTTDDADAVASGETIEIASPKARELWKIINDHPNSPGLVYSQFEGAGGLNSISRFLQSMGCTEVTAEHTAKPPVKFHHDDEKFHHDDENEKISNMFENDSSVASNKFGHINDDYLRSIENEMISNNYFGGENDNIDTNTKGGGLKYAIISGKVSPDDRSKLVEMFTDKRNLHGGIIDILLVTATGAEGLDLKALRYVVSFEPYWTYNRNLQLFARARRNDSHIDLPPEEKNFTPYVLLAVPPESEKDANGNYLPTTDTEIYEESLKNQAAIDSFNEAIEEVSIECIANGGKNCRRCTPNNQPLYNIDPSIDITTGDPCIQSTETEIEATLITLDGEDYYYVPDESALYDYKIFYMDKTIGVYKVLPVSDSRHEKIIDLINAKTGGGQNLPEYLQYAIGQIPKIR